MGVNNLPSIVTWKWNSRRRTSDILMSCEFLTTTLPHHTYTHWSTSTEKKLQTDTDIYNKERTAMQQQKHDAQKAGSKVYSQQWWRRWSPSWLLKIWDRGRTCYSSSHHSDFVIRSLSLKLLLQQRNIIWWSQSSDKVLPHCWRSEAVDKDVTALHTTLSSAVRIHSTIVIPVHSQMSSVQRLLALPLGLEPSMCPCRIEVHGLCALTTCPKKRSFLH